MKEDDIQELQAQVRSWSVELGFQQVGFCDTNLSNYESAYRNWIKRRMYGDMTYMTRNVAKRLDPAKLVPNTISVISLRMDYLHQTQIAVETNPNLGVVSNYAQGRDYHKLIRRRIAELGKRINTVVESEYRAFVDSAPVLEKPLATKAGLGWIGKNTLILNEHSGSFFFLGELFTNIPFKSHQVEAKNQCGKCSACMTICPTDAIIEPGLLDARRCISYLTIEHKGVIPEHLRKAVGNRIFGCDDCQTICPWNRYASPTQELDFAPRHGLDRSQIVDLLQWDEATFLARSMGMALRRINYSQWVRNLAVAAGNAQPSENLLNALNLRKQDAKQTDDDLALEHIDWALNQLTPQTNLERSDPDTV